MPKLNDFKALLFDVDKTITRTDRHLSRATAAAFEKLKDTSLLVSACTGRSYGMMVKEDLLRLFHEDALHVCCGGGLVIRNNGSVLHEANIDSATVQSIYTVVKKAGVGFILKKAHEMYANRYSITRYTEILPVYKDTFKPIEDLTDFTALALVILNADSSVKNFLATQNITTKDMKWHNNGILTDITKKGITKAQGLALWCEEMNIKPAEIIGFGDSDNDLEFLSEVGFAVALGNATDNIKSVADRVIGHTDEDGLAVYLESILQGAEL